MVQDIKEVMEALMNQSFKDAYDTIRGVQTRSGAALRDILTDLTKHVLVLKDLPNDVKRYLLIKMADVEYNLSFATIEAVQLAGLVGAFAIARDKIGTIMRE